MFVCTYESETLKSLLSLDGSESVTDSGVEAWGSLYSKNTIKCCPWEEDF
jgi:hypothetical protein